MDPSSSLPANHLLMKLRGKVITSCKHSQAREAREKAVEMGQLNIESVRYHCGPYSDRLGIYLLDMADILLIEMGRIQEARKYLTEAKRVLEVTHGPQHSLMLTKVQELHDLAEWFPLLSVTADNTCLASVTDVNKKTRPFI
ncbi:uncharacterized protein LOC115929021 [Strongylocentrotus purpuratus]|uniref:Uncharacterized protein n=1 Tax=Strongylocentrotus purpuratus TaxID=7668 RepID=A0A7M7PJM1_STRPU|nr:uncharacterized protein LOC115929021 [Strongylocentrotus purpuratus]